MPAFLIWMLKSSPGVLTHLLRYTHVVIIEIGIQKQQVDDYPTGYDEILKKQS